MPQARPTDSPAFQNLFLQCLVALNEPYQQSGFTDSGIREDGYPIVLSQSQVGRSTTWSIPFEFELYRTGPVDGEFNTVPLCKEISSDPGSEATFMFIAENIRECLSAHQHCAKRVEKLPTRLIRIEPGSNTMRLIETPPYMKDPYVALSHCWGVGNGDRLILTKDTLSVLLCSISTSILCPIYTDAVIVCRKLGIKYLWIDSLCIIQDDPDDWEYEVTKMADVYEGAHLTIYASCCAGPGDSFLAARDLSSWKCASRPITFSKQKNPGEYLKVRRRVRVGRHSNAAQYQLTPPKISSDEFDPLERRAWAFQEFYLSTRLAIFSSEEVQWLCKQSEACECRPDDDKRMSLRERFSVGKAEDLRQEWQAWEEIVSQFSSLRLTFGKDKLPALSGLAVRMQERFKTEYFAGLWKNRLGQSMCWQSKRWAKVEPAPNEYQAPTFSWASINGPVQYPSTPARHESFAEVIQLKCTFKGKSPFGEVAKSSITLRGISTLAFLSTPAESPTHNDSYDWWPVWLFWGEDENSAFFRLRFPDSTFTCDGRIDTYLEESIIGDTTGRTQRTVRRSCSHLQSAIHDAPVLCMRLRKAFNKDGELFVFFLVLGLTDIDGAYERLGLAMTIEPPEEFDDFPVQTITII